MPSLCNAFLAGEPGSTFGSEFLRAMPEAFDGTWSNHCCFLPQELSERLPGHIRIEPQDSFFKHPATVEGIHTLLRGCDRELAGVFSMHLWAHLWWSRWRRDFSRFHAGKMTENFIRNVDTTYNLAARRFLPSKRKIWSFAGAVRALFHREEAA